MTQVIKTVCGNAFIAWRMLQKEDVIRDVDKNINSIRNSLINKVCALMLFIHVLQLSSM